MADSQKYVDKDGLVYYDSKIKQFIKDKFDSCFKFGGAISFEELPLPDEEELNFVYQITNKFISDSRFDVPKKSYEPGALVYVVKTAEDLYKFSILIESSKVDTSVIESRLDELETQQEQTSNDISNLNNGLRDLENQVSEIDTTLSTSVENIQEELQQVKHDVTAVTQKTDQLSDQISEVETTLTTTKQDKLVSGESLATINGKSLLAGGNIDIEQKDLVFTIDKLTDIEVGGIPVGTDLNGMLITDILKKLLYKVVADVVTNYRPSLIEGTQYGPVFVGATNTEVYSAPTNYPILEETSTSKVDYREQGYYKVLNESAEVVEQGFQVTTSVTGRGNFAQMLISVPPKLILMYDPQANSWVDSNRVWKSIRTVTVESSTGGLMKYYLYQDKDSYIGSKYFRLVI